MNWGVGEEEEGTVEEGLKWGEGGRGEIEREGGGLRENMGDWRGWREGEREGWREEEREGLGEGEGEAVLREEEREGLVEGEGGERERKVGRGGERGGEEERVGAEERGEVEGGVGGVGYEVG